MTTLAPWRCPAAMTARLSPAWACATTDHSDALLFKAMAEGAERRVGDFNAQNLANIAWAFATVGQLDA